MSKTRWEKSVWGSFFSRLTRSVRPLRSARRRSQRQRLDSMGVAELLETRITPVVGASFAAGVLTITGDAAAEAVTVQEKLNSADIYDGATLFTTVTIPTNVDIASIVMVGNGGVDSLTITGNGPTLSAVTLTGVATLSVNARPTGGTLTVDANGSALTFGNSTIIGNLTVTDVAAVTQTASPAPPAAPIRLSVSGLATITTNTPATDDITLTNAANSFGSLDLEAEVINITEAGDTVLADIDSAAVTGSLTVISTGNVTDNNDPLLPLLAINVTGAVSVSTPTRDITLDKATNTFGTLTLTGADITIVEAAATVLGAVTAAGPAKGRLSVTSTGAITDTAGLAVSTAGNTTLSGASIALK